MTSVDHALIAAAIFSTGALTGIIVHSFDPSATSLYATVAFFVLMVVAIAVGAALDNRERRGL